MQLPTCTGIRIRTMSDAHVIFHAVSLGMLPMVSRRLDIEERRYIHSGCVCVWEERSASSGESSSATGIERWTDGRRWGPSRVRDEFLYYHEKLPEFEADEELSALMCVFGSRLIKQTYSVFVDTPTGRRKWHLVAYFTGEPRERLLTVDDIPELAAIRHIIPPGKYTTARLARQRSSRQDTVGPNSLGFPDAAITTNSSSTNSATTTRPGPNGSAARHPLYTIDIDQGNLPSPHAPSSDVRLPALKPPPWSPPRWPEDELATRQPDLHGAQSVSLRRNGPSIDLAPLIYLRKRPYPPRDTADDDILQKFDCGIV
ncbi:Gti1/Pac2 family-domain-containing protein [Cubamyces lactineus]|nr:Gti1/Pac2 family-domain-containing protein [Cubamyces lactineus]